MWRLNGRTWVVALLIALSVGMGGPGETRDLADTATVSGHVVTEAGDLLSGATVRVQATDNHTRTDASGQFKLTGLREGVPITVSAWKDAYYCAKVEDVVPPATGVVLSLHRYQTTDNPDYEWVPPVGAHSCMSCKPGVTRIWLENAHAEAAINPRFLTMYNGTDMHGRQSPPTRYGYNRDYGSFPLPPDPDLPYYGPGYKLDFPDSKGNCAACHTPGAAVDAAYDTDPNMASGADLYGVHCDFCHKVADVELEPTTGMPFANMPGVLSMEVRRPFTDDPERFQLFFGTFDDDNVPEEDTYLPLIETSQFCAACHFGVFWDTVVYNSFGEWLDSPYSDPLFSGAQTCQQCHMPAPSMLGGEPITNVAPTQGGVERDPQTIHAHIQLGARHPEFLQEAVTMHATASRNADALTVEVRITNDKTGHHVPTDSPLRHLILLVKATTADGRQLQQVSGPTVPDWGGVGDPEDGYYAGLPGKAFAKVLEELWTEVSPTGAYWNPTRVLSDNRIPALATDKSEYAFTAPERGDVNVEVTLIYRRAYKELMDWKKWEVPDVVMERLVLRVEHR